MKSGARVRSAARPRARPGRSGGLERERAGDAECGYTLRIGDVVPFTGASAVFGPAYAKAAGLAVQEAKKALRANGITNIKIQIEHADDATTPEGGVNAARKLSRERRRLHARRADLGELDRDRAGRDGAGASPPDRAEQLQPGADDACRTTATSSA